MRNCTQDVSAGTNADGGDLLGNAMPVDANKRALDAGKRFWRPDSHPSRKTSLHEPPTRFCRYGAFGRVISTREEWLEMMERRREKRRLAKEAKAAQLLLANGKTTPAS